MTHVLFVEDEADLAKIVKDCLRTRDFKVTHCTNGKDGLSTFLTEKPQIVVLDVMMPYMDGFTLAAAIRERDGEVPIIFLSARTQTADVIKGFETGANDDLKKPFSIDELIVRILFQTKTRKSPEVERFIRIGTYTLDTSRHILSNGTQAANLSFRESELLKILYQHRQQGASRHKILTALWNDDSFFSGRSLDVFISRLRKHLAADPSVRIINIRGIGYQLLI